jgi:hypothetical protein
MLMKVVKRWRWRGIEYDPFDLGARERIAERMFAFRKDEAPVGTVRRGQVILEIIESSFPTAVLTGAYFENLELLLKSRKPRASPGQVLLGLGSGRSGSTSLAEILATVEMGCCTHENPPLISWRHNPEELQFHMRRLKLLAQYFDQVADVSHWWLNVLDEVFVRFPGAKAVGLIRDLGCCTKSFMRMKGSGLGSYNHWVPYGNDIWAAAPWDPTYPTYAVPEDAARDPDGAKVRLIARYVREYNERLTGLVAGHPERILLIRTEDLSKVAAQEAIFEFAGVRGLLTNATLNVNTMTDGRSSDYKF